MAEVMDRTEAVFVTLRYSTGHGTFDVLSKPDHVPASALWHRKHGRPPREEVAAQKVMRMINLVTDFR